MTQDNPRESKLPTLELLQGYLGWLQEEARATRDHIRVAERAARRRGSLPILDEIERKESARVAAPAVAEVP